MTRKRSQLLKASLSTVGFGLLLTALIFTDVLPIGYKHVTYPQQTAFLNTQEAHKMPKLTCPDAPVRPVKMHYHVAGERAMYNERVFATLCPTYAVTFLLYW